MGNVMSMSNFAKELNDITFTDYYLRLSMMARKRFKWSNLPDGIKEEYIEKFLFYYGSCLFFKDKTFGLMVAKCNPTGKLNYYDEHTRLQPYGTGYTGKSYENGVDCVLIKNNDNCLPTDMTIKLFSYRLAEITRTSDVNINAQKTPVIVLCSDKQKMTMKNVFKQTNENEIVIYGDKNLDIEAIKALRIDAPIVFDKLRIEKTNIWNEAMSFMGLNNANTDKRERLVDDEVNANNEQIEASIEVMLASRQQACEEINKMFDLNISVELRNQEKPELEDVEEMKEGA